MSWQFSVAGRAGARGCAGQRGAAAACTPCIVATCQLLRTLQCLARHVTHAACLRAAQARSASYTCDTWARRTGTCCTLCACALRACAPAVHVYQVHEDEGGPAEDEEGEEGVPSYVEWMLPAAHLEGAWGALHFDTCVRACMWGL